MVLVCIGCIITVAVIDLLCKWYVESHVHEEKVLKQSKERVIIRKVHNRGAMLNHFENHSKRVRDFSFFCLILVLLYEIFLFRKPGGAKEKLGVALVAGGAVSNTYDRIRRGYVVDYIGFNCKQKKLAKITYNLGDFAIFAGVFLVLLENVFKRS